MSEPHTDYLTPSQREALEAELAELEGPKRAAAIEAIKVARSYGDLSENFEYHSAKNEQGFLEARIRKLRARLESSVTVEHETDESVGVGSIVELADEDGEKMEVEISAVGGGVAPDSPLGQALHGRGRRRRRGRSGAPRCLERARARDPARVVPAALAELHAREEVRFAQSHPRSYELAERARESLFEGVPMHWMRKWPGGFPVFVAEAKGARFVDVDGIEYVDFCLGDTGSMTGHAPEPTLRALSEQAAKGITLMLPTEDAHWVAEELTRRFGLPSWQFALTATDANRFSIRLARHVTNRHKVLVFNWCYHGTVDEAFATLVDGAVEAREGNLGPPVNPAETTRVVEFNDVEALERELAHGDVALVLAEPALTNIGIVHPEPGFHDALRELTRLHGTLLAIDETHTICCGPGGFTAANGLEPDLVTIGKTIAGGIPAAAYGFSEELAARLTGTIELGEIDVGGIGGTLAGNALSLAATRATLAEVLTEEAFARMIPLAERWTEGVESAIAEAGLPWHVTRLGCRAEYLFGPDRPRNGSEAHAAGNAALERYMHLFALNRGILLTPFHNMALMSPATTEADVDRHTEVFREAVVELAGADLT